MYRGESIQRSLRMNIEDMHAQNCKLAKKAELYTMTMDYGDDEIIMIGKLYVCTCSTTDSFSIKCTNKMKKVTLKMIKDASLRSIT